MVLIRSCLDESVAEHAIAFYFALRRNLVGMYSKMVDGKEEWKAKGSLISYVSGSGLLISVRFSIELSFGNLDHRALALMRTSH